MHDADDGPRTLTTVENTCAVIDALKEHDGATITELADHLGMSKGGVYNHLVTLEGAQFVRKVDDVYRLSARFFNVGEYVKHHDPLYRSGKTEVERLAEETGESTHLMVEQFGRGYYYHKVPAERGISREFHRNLMEHSDYLHWSSTGKAVLAELPPERVHRVIDRHGLPAETEHTITDEDELLDELATIRERGYALQDEEQILGARAVGSAVTDADGRVLGAISVSGPVSRIDDEMFREELPELVTRTTNVVEVNLETSTDSSIRTL